MSEQTKRNLCVKEERYGTLDIWVNPEGKVCGNNNIVVTYNGETIEEGFAYGCDLQKCENIEQALDWLMGYIDRDTQNWYWKDLVIHWGVHTLRFINEKNINVVEKDEYTKTLEDIQMNYDVEW